MEMFSGIQPQKVEKAAKETKGMFQSLIGASLGPVGIIMNFIETLKPFMVIMKILEGLFKIMMGEAIKPLFEALKPVMNVLMSLSPVFVLIGKVIGILLQLGLIPLTVIFKLLEKVLTPLMPLLNPLLDALDDLSPIINLITDVIVEGLIFAIKLLWFGIASFINGIASLINLIPGVNLPLLPLPSFDKGGVMPYTGYAKLKKDEIVMTPAQFNNLFYEQQETNRLLRKIIRDKRVI